MRWKWVLLIGVFLIIALAATIYVILGSYDYNKFKPQIARMVMEDTGRALNLRGDINLDIGFPTALVVEDVTFANASWGSQPEMITVARLQAKVRLLPLLFEDVKITQFSLTGVDALFETGPTGSGNWDFTAAEKPDKKAGGFKVLSIDIDDIRARDLNLKFRNNKTGSVTRFKVASLELAKQDQLDGLTLNLRAVYNKQAAVISGRIGMISHLFAKEPFPLELSGQFSNAKLNINGAIDDALNLQGINLQVQTSGTNLAGLDHGS